MNPRIVPWAFVASIGCLHDKPEGMVVPVAGWLTDPDGRHPIWRVNPSDEMVAALIGEEAFSACRTAIDSGEYHTCTVRVGCMALTVTAAKNELQFRDCRATDDKMLLSPPDSEGIIHTIKVSTQVATSAPPADSREVHALLARELDVSGCLSGFARPVELELAFVLDPSGAPGPVTVHPLALRSDVLEGCLSAALIRISFPKSPDGTARAITYPLVLR